MPPGAVDGAALAGGADAALDNDGADEIIGAQSTGGVTMVAFGCAGAVLLLSIVFSYLYVADRRNAKEQNSLSETSSPPH